MISFFSLASSFILSRTTAQAVASCIQFVS
jgi:hypothetical protein